MTFRFPRFALTIGRRRVLRGSPATISVRGMRATNLVIGTMTLVAIGMAAGLAAALVATQLIATSLFGVAPTDPITIGIATGVMAAVALLAGYSPARRAAGVDPMVALRHE